MEDSVALDMELINAGNMSYMDFTSEENPEHMYFNSSKNNLSTSIQENQNVEKPEETQKPLYKLSNLDTEASIKAEMKQLVLTKISEEITSNSLMYMTYEAEEQVSALRDKASGLEDKIEELNKEVKTDEKRLDQTEAVLLKTDEMINLLKENMEKLAIRYGESRINELWDKSTRQQEKLGLLKTSYQAQIEKEKENLKNEEALGTERNAVLKAELSQKDDMLNIIRKKQDEFKKIVSYDSEIEKQLAKKRALEIKLQTIINKRATLETAFMKQKDALDSISLKGVDVDKFTALKERNEVMEAEIETATQEMEEAKTNLAEIENCILQKEIKLKELEENLEISRQALQQSLPKLQQDFDSSCHQLEMISTSIADSNSNNNQLLKEVNTLNTIYLQKCEDKSTTVNKYFEKRSDLQRVRVDLQEKQKQNITERTKYEELKTQYEELIGILTLLENTIVKKQHSGLDELRNLKLRFENLQAEENKYFLEMKKRKDYLLNNSTCLEQKSKSLQQEKIELLESVKNLEEENMSLKVLLETKCNQLEERKGKLNTLKRTQSEMTLKSGLKSPNKENFPKKVKFNEVLSFKSPTSSEMSNLPGENITQLETSMQEWLGEQRSNELVEKMEEC